VNAYGNIFVDQERFTYDEFRASFKALAEKRGKDGAYLRADQMVPYGLVAKVLAVMRASGATDIGLVTEPEDMQR
jgi:biopolymer transport protein TolR